MTILSAENLSVKIPAPAPIQLLQDISFTLKRGETLAVIGESGSGKSTLCKAIINLLPSHFQIRGTLTYHKKESTVQTITDWNHRQFMQLHGSEIGMVFQDSAGSLNPLFPCGEQILDVLKEHATSSASVGKQQALKLIGKVGLTDVDTIYYSYPHQLSGGMSQRIALALALAGNPRVLIADEPAAALDSIAKSRYLNLLYKLKEEYGLSLIFVTHNLNDALRFSDSVMVLYNGRSIEYRKSAEIQQAPAHPYTKALLDIRAALNRNQLPKAIPGAAPSIKIRSSGCVYHPRCPGATELCRNKQPQALSITENYFVRCHYPHDTG